MERIKVTLPKLFSFSTILSIRITDLNYGGHVGNDVFMSLVHEARQQFLLYHGYSEMNFAGASLIMADAAIEYKHELLYGNQIKMEVSAGGFDKIGFDIFYHLLVKKEDQWLTAGKVKTGMLCFDYSTKRKIPVPSEVVHKLDVTNL